MGPKPIRALSELSSDEQAAFWRQNALRIKRARGSWLRRLLFRMFGEADGFIRLCAVGAFLIVMPIFGTLAYVAWHFLVKYW